MTDTFLYITTLTLTQRSLAGSIREVQKTGGAQDHFPAIPLSPYRVGKKSGRVFASMTMDLI